ncbi:MAG TPA: ABC transporter permease [Candidatus Polarisedimenticolia bacterium]|jgi:peptide/nickel transport system permease protein|nr:ABC transporter permease [Candidatus Polarisedimenticolia bacterium]
MPARSARRGLLLAALALLALLGAPFLAGEAPLAARRAGLLCFPALAGVPLVGTGLDCPGGDPIDWAAVRKAGGDGILLSLPIPYGPYASDLDSIFEAPSPRHWMGTDSLGRDVASRLVHGIPVAFTVGGLATLLALILGITLGAFAGAGGRWTDLTLSRLIDLVACFPTLVLALALVAASVRPGIGVLVFSIAATRWTGIARFFRGEVLRQRDLSYCEAARAAGAGRSYLLARHILPNALSPILITAAFSVGSAVLLEAGMSFLGLGLPPPAPSWGSILAEARDQVVPAWWLVLFPSMALFATVLGCILLAEGYRDSTDPRITRVG